MKYGMNLLLWTDDPTQESFLPLYERLKAMGFDGVELPIFDAVPERYEALGRRLDDMGLLRTAVTVRNAENDPISADPAIRAAAANATKLAVDCCEAARATHLVGPFYAAIGCFSGAPPTADEWQRSVTCMQQVADHAARADVHLSFEFLNRFEIYLLNCAADAARFVREVDRPNCSFLYDTFHANIEEKDVAGAIRDNAAELGHVHISENDRSTPGRGQVDWKTSFDTLAEVGYAGWLVIEAFGQALPALVAATKIWRRMFDDEETLAREGLAFMKKEWEQRAG
jgi:D-psicose/D-tagatose/L-ribulose 3-epimerase